MTQGRMISDNELIVRSRAGDPDAEEELAVRYSPLVRFYSRTYFLAGGDSEDLIQEGMIGLLSAIRRFDPAMSVSFRTYADQCVRNRIISAIQSASRLKHTPLNYGVSFEDLLNKEPNTIQAAYYDSFSRRTEEQVLAREREEEILIDNTKQLSRFERSVLVLYLQGLSSKEIAERMDRNEKSIDNAVQRIRKKIMRNE